MQSSYSNACNDQRIRFERTFDGHILRHRRIDGVGHFCCKFQASQGLKAKRQKDGDNTLSQVHHNGTLQKGKAIMLNSVEIKIVRAEAKSPP